MTTLLEVKNLVTRFYVPDGVVHAVNGISYSLDRGESLALVGESGCGKSVSALSLLGLVPSPPGVVEQGEVLFQGVDLLRQSERQLRHVRGGEIGMVFQDPMTSLNPVLTVGKQLGEGIRLHLGLETAVAQKRAIELLNLVGIPDAANRLNDYPHQFSGGQRQRIMIAMALSCDPALLIADEPTTALDVTIQAQIVSLVKQLKEKLGMSVIWITHDLGVVASLVDKVAVMYAGFIVEMSRVADLYTETSHPYTLGLLESLPKVDAKERQRLIPIEGTPPDLREEPDHCPFAPRCRFAVAHCWQENPPLQPIGPQHSVACWRWDVVQAAAKKEQPAEVAA
ncbi:MAG: ABC transporter ATP-binding protein [Ardenticatenaceae bacterium]|nr:ABC transporter ATP-binding protein [Anaerolineales bacterium]MCB8978531.1 ABC transporter ATP-binding protein [Ardenticatenaceae bacterium]